MLVEVSSSFLKFEQFRAGIFFRAVFEQFLKIRAEHFRAEIRENCSKLLENARIANFEHCSKSPSIYRTNKLYNCKIIFCLIEYKKLLFNWKRNNLTLLET